MIKFIKQAHSLVTNTHETIKKIGSILLMIVGVIIALGSILWSFSFPQMIAVPLASAGAVAGAMLFLFGLRLHGADTTPEGEKDAKIRQLQKSIQALEQKIKELTNASIGVNSFKHAFSLNLLDVELKLRDFRQKEISNINNYGVEYLGCIERDVTMILGIDMEKVTCQEEDDQFVVSGIKCVQTGYKDPKKAKKFREIRHKRTSSNGKTRSQWVELNDNRLQQYADEHDADLDARLHAGSIQFEELTGVARFVEEMGKKFIEAYFAPTGKTVKFVDANTTALTKNNPPNIEDSNDTVVPALLAPVAQQTQL
jgi:hypothetical protein